MECYVYPVNGMYECMYCIIYKQILCIFWGENDCQGDTVSSTPGSCYGDKLNKWFQPAATN